MMRALFFLLFWALGLAPWTDLRGAPAATSESVPPGAVLPLWPAISPPEIGPDAPTVRSGDLELIHSKTALGGFVVRVLDRSMAVGCAPMLIGYVKNGEMRWVNSAASLQKQSVARTAGGIHVVYDCADPEGADWHVERQYQLGRVKGSVEIQTDVRVSQNRSVAFMPMLLVFPGAGSFGETKGQALFAGLEYLGNEPSSSEADVIGPAAKRQVPDNLKITFPLMAVQNEDRYIGLSWQMRPFFSALFDSPDRLFHSGGHVMGVLFPGSDGKNRQEGSLLPRITEFLHGGQTVTLRATLFAGRGRSVVPAVQGYVKQRPLPPVPGAFDLEEYAAQAVGGWLDSKIREGNLIRHALAGSGFPPQPAADAALWMQWLASRQSDPARATRLRQTATNVLSEVPPANLNVSGVGHVRYPVESLIFGHVAENADQAKQQAQALLARFEPDGSVEYRPQPGKPDFSKTHFSKQASGLASRVVLDLLQAAAFSGDKELIQAGLERLRALEKFDQGVPRGAQTWECPLHTPDILASAQLVRAFVLGYELSGQASFLEQARYWAWTGVPFVYLVAPTDQAVGLYATIPVFGATQWRAPVWLGLPVQWCGLVYADALYQLVRVDSTGPWQRIADGITASGIQQTWPQTNADYQGLLPDSFVLREQKRNGPAINPATVEACAAQFFNQSPVYDFRCFRANGVMVHAPGPITAASESKGHVSFQVESWVQHPYYVLVNGVSRKPEVKLNGSQADSSDSQQFSESPGRLILKLDGKVTVSLEL